MNITNTVQDNIKKNNKLESEGNTEINKLYNAIKNNNNNLINNINQINQNQTDSEIIDLNSNSNQENKKGESIINNPKEINIDNKDINNVKTIQVNLINSKNNNLNQIEENKQDFIIL